MMRPVKSEAEFLQLLPSLKEFLEHSRKEWEFYYRLEDMLSLFARNKERLYYGLSIKSPVVMCFFEHDYFLTGNSQIRVFWSAAPGGVYHTEKLVKAAKELAAQHNASRLLMSACRPLTKELKTHGFSCNALEMIKDI